MKLPTHTAHLFRHSRRIVLACALVALAGPSAAAPVVEFYNAGLDNYFITANPAEASAIDGGAAGPGWSRTGIDFGDGGPTPVCRFYGSLSPGPNSHFYTALPEECAALKQLQQTTPITQKRWNFESLDFSTTIPASGACAADKVPVYRAYNNGFGRGIDSNHRITTSLAGIQEVVGRGWSNEGVVMCAPPFVTEADVEADIVRLLEQATMGPTEALIAEVKQKGIPAWIDAQLGLNESRYAERVPYRAASVEDSLRCFNDIVCRFTHVGLESLQQEFFSHAISGRDQLRQRFAYVLHQLFVLGQGGPSEVYGNRNFQQLLRDVVFSTYENALYEYTVSPQLGMFQGWANNMPEHDGIKPNENFAREIQQLLTTGVYRLNEDGTEQKDSAGVPIPAYTQADVTTMSRVLTGYTYPPERGVSRFPNPDYFVGRMVPFDDFHDKGAKSLYSGAVKFPAGQGAEADVKAAIKALVAQPGTPPFIVKQFIQRMVTSSPSPDYVRRVVAVFKDNGAGVRGDMAAVVRAILLDPEARGPRKTDPKYGRMREPALFMTSMLRALDIRTDYFFPLQLVVEMNTPLFSPPTIFSYFPADFRIFNGALPAAEFGIYGTSAYVTRTNTVNRLVVFPFGPQPGPDVAMGPNPTIPGATGTFFPSMTAFLASTADPAAFVQRLNRLFFHNAMSAATRTTMTNAIAAIPASNALTRARMGVYLALTSVAYQIQK